VLLELLAHPVPHAWRNRGLYLDDHLNLRCYLWRRTLPLPVESAICRLLVAFPPTRNDREKARIRDQLIQVATHPCRVHRLALLQLDGPKSLMLTYRLRPLSLLQTHCQRRADALAVIHYDSLK
jgi:hypothetical protein